MFNSQLLAPPTQVKVRRGHVCVDMFGRNNRAFLKRFSEWEFHCFESELLTSYEVTSQILANGCKSDRALFFSFLFCLSLNRRLCCRRVFLRTPLAECSAMDLATSGSLVTFTH